MAELLALRLVAELLALKQDALGTRSGKLGPRDSAHLASRLQSGPGCCPHSLGRTLVTAETLVSAELGSGAQEGADEPFSPQLASCTPCWVPPLCLVLSALLGHFLNRRKCWAPTVFFNTH